MYCKNCNQKDCNNVEGDFDCLGLPNKTTVTTILKRANELLCTACVRPIIELESSCTSSNLLINLVNKGSASKVTIEVYKEKDKNIFKSIRVSENGNYTLNIPYGKYKIKAFDSYNFECTTSFINYDHQCSGNVCVQPIVTLNTYYNPTRIVANIISLGEAEEVRLQVFKDNTQVFSTLYTEPTSVSIPVSLGIYSVNIIGYCINGEASESHTIRIVDHNCGINVLKLTSDCDTGYIDYQVYTPSGEVEFSLDQINWVSNPNLLGLREESTYNLIIRDKNNTTCFTYYEFSTLCKCQLSFNISDMQCLTYDCILDFNISEMQCSDNEVCVISGTVIIQ